MHRVAYLIPVFNDQCGLNKSLQSLAESEGGFDVVVVDDGSTPCIAVEQNEFPFSVRLISLDENQGIEAALNSGAEWIEREGYEFVARLDAGDVHEDAAARALR